MLAFVNNKFVPFNEATIGIGDLSIQRGYGIFDYFRTNKNVPLFLSHYLDRFYSSAEKLRLQPEISREDLTDVIFELIRQNNIPESGFRMILTGGYSPDSYEPVSPNLIIIQQAIQLPSNEKVDKGLRIITHKYMRDVPEAKSINYVMGIYLQEKVMQQQAEDVLYYNDHSILEFPRSNVFIVTRDGSVVTPGDNVLAGITRMKVLELAGNTYKAEHRNIPLEELYNAAEVFLTSTTKRILPIVSIDGKPVGDGKPGKVTKALLQEFIEMEESLLV